MQKSGSRESAIGLSKQQRLVQLPYPRLRALKPLPEILSAAALPKRQGSMKAKREITQLVPQHRNEFRQDQRAVEIGKKSCLLLFEGRASKCEKVENSALRSFYMEWQPSVGHRKLQSVDAS